VEALAKFAQRRSASVIPLLTTSLVEQFVDRTPGEITKLIGREQAREREFLRRQRVRMTRDLPEALREADPGRRQERIDKLLARERHYMRLREEALTARAHSAVESLDIEEASPEGAFWMLSDTAKHHTPGCIAMAGKFWPWRVLREVIHPPVHPGCPCYLLTLDEAVARGLMTHDQVPDTGDAMTRAMRNRAMEEALIEEFGTEAILEAMLDLTEVEAAHLDRPKVKARRYAKGFEKGGQWMPKIGGSPGAAIRKLLPKARKAATAKSGSGRAVWMKGHRVNVPENETFSRKVGDSHFTSPPGSTNVYRDGKLASTPDEPALHPDMQRPRGSTKQGRLAKRQAGKLAGTGTEDRRKAQSAQIEKALRAAEQGTSPVKVGDNGETAHRELAVAGFTPQRSEAKQTNDSLIVPYVHPDGHVLNVTIDRRSGLVTAETWQPGDAPTDTTALRAKRGLDQPKPPAKPETPAKPRLKPGERAAREEEARAQATLGTGDPVWRRQLTRAQSDDEGAGDAQWDLIAEARARGPNSDYATRLKAEVGAATYAKWERDTHYPAPPDSPPDPHYEVKKVKAADTGPTVGAGVHAGVAGGQGDSGRTMGTGHYFTSKSGPGSADHGVDLAGAKLHRPQNAASSRALAHALGILNGIADEGGWAAHRPDPQTGEMRVWTLNDALNGLPIKDQSLSYMLAEQAIARHRDDPKGEVAATHMMRGLGFDGVDNRHIAELDHPAHGSVVYEAPKVTEAHSTGDVGSPQQGGSVVRGVMGRWVWVRGANKHVPLDREWRFERDGMSFISPAGTTDVFHVVPTSGEHVLISRVGTPQTHPYARNPRLAASRRGASPPVVAPPVTHTRPNFTPGQSVAGVDADGVPRAGTVTGVYPAPNGTYTVTIQDHDNRQQWWEITGASARVAEPPTPEIEPVQPPDEPAVPEPQAGSLGAIPVGTSVRLGNGAWGPPGEYVVTGHEPQNGRVNLRGPAVVPPGAAAGTGANGVTWAHPDLVLEPAPRVPTPDPPQPPVHTYTGHPEGTGLTLSPGHRDLLLTGRVPSADGTHFADSQVEALNATGLPDGHLTFGPGWLRMTPDERQQALDHAYGRALARSITEDDGSRDELSALWTGGKFTRATGGLPAHTEYLDRYNAEEAVAVAHARMNGEGWRDFKAQYPEVAGWVAVQAEFRGHSVRPDVHDWIEQPAENGNVHDPTHPLPNDAREFAQSLAGVGIGDARARLANEGYLRGDSNVGGRGHTTYRKVDTAQNRVLTISLTIGAGDGSGVGTVERADGTAYGFDPNAVPPPGNTPEQDAYALRGRTHSDAGRELESRGYRKLATVYTGSAVGGGSGRGDTTVWAKPDSGIGIHVMLDSTNPPRPGGPLDWGVDARPVVLSDPEHTQRMALFVDEPDGPQKVFVPGTTVAQITTALRGKNWRATRSETSDGGQYLNLIRLDRPDHPTEASAQSWRIKVGPASAAGDDQVVERVGRPGLSGSLAARGGEGFAVDDADAQAFIDAQNTGLRQVATARRERIDALKERLRVGSNAGNNRALQPGDQMPDVVTALDEMGFKAKATRKYQETGRSVTWTNLATGAEVITRSKPNPDADARSRSLSHDKELIRDFRERPQMRGSDDRHLDYNVAERIRSLLSRDEAGVAHNSVVNGVMRQGHMPDAGRVRGPEGSMPRTPALLAADLLGLSDEMAARYGAEQENMHVRFAGAGDRSRYGRGFNGANTGGQILLGNEVQPAMERMIALRAEGREPTEREMAAAFKAYKVSVHEVVHGVTRDNTLDWRKERGPTHGYDPLTGAAGIEESLTEELSHQLTIEQLRRHGHEDVIRWAETHPDDTEGTYQQHRANFVRLLETMGLDSQADRREAMEQWCYRDRHEERQEDMARRVMEATNARGGGTEQRRGEPGVMSIEQARDVVRSTMSVPTMDHGMVRPAGEFRRALYVNYSRPSGAPPYVPPEPRRVDSRYRAGQHVTYTLPRHEGHLTGEIREVQMGRAPNGVTETGWQYRLGVGSDGTTSLWVPESDIVRATAAPSEPPSPPPPPPPPPEPRTVTANVNDGGTVTVGAVVYGNSSHQFAQVTGIEGGQIQVRRADNSTGNYPGSSYGSAVVNDQGVFMKAGDTVTIPVGPGEATGMDQHNGSIMTVDWSVPEHPMVTVRTANRGDLIVPGRTLTKYGSRNADPTAVEFNLPLVARDGASRNAVVGEMVRLADGRVGTLRGSVVGNWPMGAPEYEVQIGGDPNDASRPIERVPREGISGYAAELPRVQPVSGADTEIRALQMVHFNRQNGGVLAQPFGNLLGTAAGPGFETWAQANGLNLPRSGREVMEDVYTASFKGQHEFDALNPMVRDAVLQLATEMGLPSPNWVGEPQPIGPPGIPGGPINSEDVLRAIFKGRFGREGYSVHATSITASASGGSAQGSIKDNSGRTVGSFSRSLRKTPDGSWMIYNGSMAMQGVEYEGTGFATAFNAHCFAAYKAKGVREVQVSAAMSGGGYAWAATGFDFQVGNESTPLGKAQYRARLARRLAEGGRSKLTPEEWAYIEPKLWNEGSGEPLRVDHVQHAWELAYIDGRPGGKRGTSRPLNIGQKILRGQSWGGIRMLQAPVPAREGAEARGPIPGGRPGGPDAAGAYVAPTPPPRMRAQYAQAWIRHDIGQMTGPYRMTVRDIATAQAAVHPGVKPRAPHLVVRREAVVVPEGTRPPRVPPGQYHPESGQITLDPANAMDQREVTLATQYGNHLYATMIDPIVGLNATSGERSLAVQTAWRGLMTAVQGTGHGANLTRLRDNRYISDDEYAQASSQRAIFARMYAQYLGANSGDKRLRKQITKKQRNYGSLYMSAAHYRDVSEPMAGLMAALQTGTGSRSGGEPGTMGGGEPDLPGTMGGGEPAHGILGNAEDTQQLHSHEGADGRRIYSADRLKLHDQIIDTLLRRKDGTPLRPPADGQKRVLFMAGGSASGKSSALALPENQDMQPFDAALVNPDEIKEMFPEYKAMVAAGDTTAAMAAHEESSDLSKRLLAEAMRRGLNVVRDGTGDSNPGKFAGQITDMKDAGYDVTVLYVNAKTAVALRRGKRRAKRTGRHVPDGEIRKQHKNVSARFLDGVRPLVEDGAITQIRMYQTQGKAKLFAEGGAGPHAKGTVGEHSGVFHVRHEGLYAEFAAKAHENTDEPMADETPSAFPGIATWQDDNTILPAVDSAIADGKAQAKHPATPTARARFKALQGFVDETHVAANGYLRDPSMKRVPPAQRGATKQRATAAIGKLTAMFDTPGEHTVLTEDSLLFRGMSVPTGVPLDNRVVRDKAFTTTSPDVEAAASAAEDTTGSRAGRTKILLRLHAPAGRKVLVTKKGRDDVMVLAPGTRYVIVGLSSEANQIDSPENAKTYDAIVLADDADHNAARRAAGVGGFVE
jgi:predicted ABC-type ATPase